MEATQNAAGKKLKAKRHKRVNRSVGGNILAFTMITLLGLFMALPLVYAIGNAFKPLDELWIFPPPLFPRNPTLRNFTDLFVLLQNSWVPISRYFFNTVFITVTGTAGQLILASMCAYPLAKHPFPGAKFIFQLIVLSLMFNATVTAIPNYLIMSTLGWVDTYRAIIVPAMGSTLGLFLIKQFMEQLPTELLEAANIDGAGEMCIFWHVVMPNVKPAWLTLMVFSVQSLWNMGSNPFIYSEQLKSLSYAINQIVAGGIARAGVGSAVIVIMMAVPITVFICTQSNIIETMASSGLKD